MKYITPTKALLGSIRSIELLSTAIIIVISLAISIASSNDKIPQAINTPLIKSLFANQALISNTLENISIGIFSSTLFYIAIVFIPKKIKKFAEIKKILYYSISILKNCSDIDVPYIARLLKDNDRYVHSKNDHRKFTFNTKKIYYAETIIIKQMIESIRMSTYKDDIWSHNQAFKILTLYTTAKSILESYHEPEEVIKKNAPTTDSHINLFLLNFVELFANPIDW